MLPVNKIENLVKEKMKDTSTVSHSFDHLKRTAVGAQWFAKVLGAKREDQETAYVAGLVHDFKRPLSEVEHKHTSVEEARKFLTKINIDVAAKRKILKMIEEHRYASRTPLMEQCLFLSDKLLEQSGAYIIFRRCIYVGECMDFKDMPFFDSMIFQWKERMNRFRPEMFGKRLSALANYQYKWQTDFFDAMTSSEAWAVDIAKQCYDAGKSGNVSLAKIISRMKTTRKGKEFKDEAMRYMSGKKFAAFKKMIA